MKQTKLKRFEEGDVLFKEGENSREMYIIRSGTVKVMIYKNGKKFPITELSKGHYVGEMSFLTGTPRSATVVAASPLLVSLITPDILNQDNIGLSGWAVSIAKVLIRRIRKTTELLGNYLLTSQDEPRGRRKGDEQEKPFSLLYSPIWENRIYLKGYLGESSIDEIKAQIRTVQLKGISPVVLDFSDVIDIDNPGISFLYELIQSYKVKNKEILIENIQLIRDKVMSLKGIQDIVVSTETPIKRVEAGEALISQGSVENIMYVVKSGSFSILRSVKGQDVKLAQVNAGDVIGEMSLVKEGVRSASVVADKASLVYCIDTREFYKNTYNVPSWFMELIKGLVERLRDTNEMVDERVSEINREAEAAKWAGAFSMTVDSQNPGKMLLMGTLTIPNLQYMVQVAELDIRRGVRHLVLDMSGVENADSESVSYLMYQYRRFKAGGISLKIENTPKDIMELFRKRMVDWEKRE